jgi:hypothetical protein
MAPASKPIRRRPLSRAFAALGDTTLQLLLAAIITAGAGFWAWTLAATAFAAPPQSASPGIIGVATESHGPRLSAPIDVQATYSPSLDSAATYLELTFTQIVTGVDTRRPSPAVVVFLCGSIALHPDFLNTYLRPVRWQVPLSSGNQFITSVFGSLSQCVYTTLSMNFSESQSSFRQAVIAGSSGLPPSHVSGTRVLYALPGIADWFVPVPIDGLALSTPPVGSTLTVNLDEDPGNFTNMFVSPQLPDAGTLTWTSTMGITVPSEYRLEADSLTAVSQLQLHLFLAGAMVGVAGGAFVWFVQVCGQGGYKAAAERVKRAKSATPREQTGTTADSETAPLAIGSPTAEAHSTGLGWPG